MGQEVCVRPINPWITPEVTKVVVDGLESKGLTAHECGKEFEPIEIWFYPLSFSLTGDTGYFLTKTRIPGGVAGTVRVQTYRVPMGSWEMSLHPNGGVWTVKRMESLNLWSESRSMGKWVNKHVGYNDTKVRR